MNEDGRLKLYGFNNLTKNLSFSFYKLHYLSNSKQFAAYNKYIKSRYSSDNLTTLLSNICHAIGGSILNIAEQDYQPHGASVTLMISEEAQPESVVAHLDKSHICVHTYPDDSPTNNIAIFRADLELSTCGVISPLKVLNFLIGEFDADVIDIDYRIRGMTRDQHGTKRFSDQVIDNISDYLSDTVKGKYQYINQNMSMSNVFHSKLSRKEVNLDDHLLTLGNFPINFTQQTVILENIDRELVELYSN
jgi:S-adenosylmethionine decarboxylase